MKVIIIKECKQGKANDIVEVSDGFAKNFLIRKQFAVPINDSTKAMLNKNLKKTRDQKKLKLYHAKKNKKKIEEITLEFFLTTTDNVVHSSITKKQILKALKEKEIIISKYTFDNIQIKSIGTTTLQIKLHTNVIAKLKIKVVSNESKP